MEDGKGGGEGRRKRRETTGERKERRLLKKKADELFVRKKREGSKKRTKISLSLTRRRLISKRRRLGRSGVVSLRGGSDDARRSCAFWMKSIRVLLSVIYSGVCERERTLRLSVSQI
jgi:hypothetical protein